MVCPVSFHLNGECELHALEIDNRLKSMSHTDDSDTEYSDQAGLGAFFRSLTRFDKPG